MPNIPWMSYSMPDGPDCHCLASVLPLRKYRDIPRFLKWTMQIRKQLETTPGVTGYGLRAELFRKRFWTLSAWESSDKMMDFVRSGAHAEMLKDMKGRLGVATFQSWMVPQATLPLGWSDARQKLRAAGASV